MAFITSTDWQGQLCTLRDEQGMAINEGTTCKDFRGDEEVIVGGRAPHKLTSSGHVFTQSGGEYYPTVFSLVWVPNEEQA